VYTKLRDQKKSRKWAGKVSKVEQQKKRNKFDADEAVLQQ